MFDYNDADAEDDVQYEDDLVYLKDIQADFCLKVGL